VRKGLLRNFRTRTGTDGDWIICWRNCVRRVLWSVERTIGSGRRRSWRTTQNINAVCCVYYNVDTVELHDSHHQYRQSHWSSSTQLTVSVTVSVSARSQHCITWPRHSLSLNTSTRPTYIVYCVTALMSQRTDGSISMRAMTVDHTCSRLVSQ